MATKSDNRSLVRLLSAWIALMLLVSIVLLEIPRFLNSQALGLGDYIAYWAAGRLNALGENPYSPEELLALQQQQGWTNPWPNIVYYPPWTLALLMPLGLLPFEVSRLIWLIINLALVGCCADALWKYFGGPVRWRFLAWLLALTFVPTLVVLRMGQIGPVLLAGITIFLLAERRRWDWLAGAALTLPAIKPHLVYLFGLGVALWAIDQRRWRILLSAAGASLAATAVALCANPAIVEQYRYALGNPPLQNITPTWGAMLRLLFGADATWLQFVPPLAGCIWLFFNWKAHRRHWSWQQQAPLLILVSSLTTSYGAWIFDLVVLLPGLLQMAARVSHFRGARSRWTFTVVYICLNGLGLVMNLREAPYAAYIWVPPAMLLCYLSLQEPASLAEGSPILGSN
jgi:hypothetical protein